MNVLSNNLTAKETLAYKQFLKASLESGHLDVNSIGGGYSLPEVKGYLSSLDKKGLIQYDEEYKSSFYVFAQFDDNTIEPAFYGEELSDDQFDAVQEFIGA